MHLLEIGVDTVEDFAVVVWKSHVQQLLVDREGRVPHDGLGSMEIFRVHPEF